jgi:type IV secretion system protein VirB8
MKNIRPPAVDRSGYYVQGESWAQDALANLRASRRLAFIVAGAACLVAVLEAIALVALMPLKTVVPYTITVDRQTGAIQAAEGIRPGALSQDEAVVQAFLAQYVLARETFDATDLQANYQKVAAWSEGAARDAYVRDMQRSNPQSPLNHNDASTLVKVTVKSISMLSRGSALVRFDTERSMNGNTPSDRRAYTAVIAYHFTGAPMAADDRFLNPLGFLVTSYRRDADAPDQTSAARVAP